MLVGSPGTVRVRAKKALTLYCDRLGRSPIHCQPPRSTVCRPLLKFLLSPKRRLNARHSSLLGFLLSFRRKYVAVLANSVASPMGFGARPVSTADAAPRAPSVSADQHVFCSLRCLASWPRLTLGFSL